MLVVSEIAGQHEALIAERTPVRKLLCMTFDDVFAQAGRFGKSDRALAALVRLRSEMPSLVHLQLANRQEVLGTVLALELADSSMSEHVSLSGRRLSEPGAAIFARVLL